MIFVPSGAARLAADVQGDGPPLVFLHAGVADRRMWRDQAQALAPTCHTIAYDRRGFGETTYAPEPHAWTDDLVAVLDATAGGAPAVLVGCSQGGRIAIDTALAHPGRVRALVLIAPAVSGAPSAEYPPAAAIMAAIEAAEAEDDLDRVNALEAHLWLDGPMSPAGRVTGPVRELFLQMNAAALRAASPGELVAPPPAWERLGEIAVPTLVLCGDLDFPHLQDRCAQIARTVPGAEGRLLAGVAHLPSLERPAEITAILEGFLAGL